MQHSRNNRDEEDLGSLEDAQSSENVQTPEGHPPTDKSPSELPLQLPGPLTPRHSSFRHLTTIFDIFLVIVAVGFMVFAFLVLSSDGQTVEDHSRGHALRVAASYGPTIFPVVFAAIIGRTLKAIATWKLERGTTIGRVEQLLGSHTVFGALMTQLQLRSFDLYGLIIVVLWALSPIGSQAALRIANAGPNLVDTTQEFAFINPQQPFHYGYSASKSTEPASSMFSSALLSVTALRGQTQDLWGNLRVPMVEALDGYQGREWMGLPSNRSDVVFSSLVGVPFSPKPSLHGLSSFTLNTSYLSLDCPIFRLERNKNCTQGFTNFTDPNKAPPLAQKNNTWYHSITSSEETDNTLWCNGFQMALSSCYRGCKCDAGCDSIEDLAKPWPARRLIWESYSDSGPAYVDCNLRTTYVDVNYTCTTPSDCQAMSVRLSGPQLPASDPGAHPNLTAFDTGPKYLAESFLRSLTSLYKIHGSAYMTPVLGYLLSPSDALTEGVNYYNKSVIEIGQTQFETRLSQLMNTFYMIGISPHTTLGISSAESAVYDPTDNTPLNTTSVMGTFTTNHEVLRCDRGWFAALLIAALVLLAATVLGTVFRSLTLVPDVLGTISLATLDNKCNNVASGGSALDGIERARWLKSVGIQLGDVEPSGDVGRIALITALNEVPVGKLERQRRYE